VSATPLSITAQLWGEHTSLVRQYSPTRNSFHSIAILPRQFEADLSGFEPICKLLSQACLVDDLRETYTNGCENILKLVDESDKAWIVYVDPKDQSASEACSVVLWISHEGVALAAAICALMKRFVCKGQGISCFEVFDDCDSEHYSICIESRELMKKDA